MACEIHGLNRRPESEESAVPRAAPGVGMHERKSISRYQRAKGLMLRGVLLLLVEAVRINFLSTLGEKKKRWKAAFEGGEDQRLTASAPHSGELAFAFAARATPGAGFPSAVLNLSLIWRVLNNDGKGLKEPENRPPNYPI